MEEKNALDRLTELVETFGDESAKDALDCISEILEKAPREMSIVHAQQSYKCAVCGHSEFAVK